MRSAKSMPVTRAPRSWSFLDKYPVPQPASSTVRPLTSPANAHNTGVSIQDAVTVSLITHLNPPIIRYAVPEIAGFFQLAVTHRSVSRRMRSVSRCWKPERSGRWRMLPTSECSAARGCHALLSEHTLLLSHQHREHQHHERHEIQHGACRMRVFPLATQFDPISRQHRPVMGRLIGGIREGPKHHLCSPNAKQGDDSEQKRLALFAHRNR